MTKGTIQQFARCRLRLKGDRWLPFDADIKPRAEHRSSPDGPVVTAIFVALVQELRIVEWRKPEFTVQDVRADGAIEPLDLRY